MTKVERSILVTKIEDSVCYIRRSTLSLGGKPISDTNLLILSRCIESWLFLNEDLMLRQCLCDEAREAKRWNFIHALASSDLVETLSALEVVYYLLYEDRCPCIDAFKQYLDEATSDGFDWRGLLSPINQFVYSFLSETDKEKKAHFLASISQFLRFPRKLEFQDIGLEAKALEGYLETEEQLAAVDYDSAYGIINDIQNIIVGWFGDFHIDNLRPIHGPGSVAEGSLDPSAKYSALMTDQILRILLSSGNMPDSYLDLYPNPPGTELSRISRTIFVPKTASKLRTISMEPVSLQYIQQGVMYEIYRFIEKHPILGVHVRLGDQTQNQIWALTGSRYHSYGTIDLSHASDSVSWDLVRRVFGRVPRLYKWLLGTRSHSTILPDGTQLHLKKFAPMGSALCFPIQCILFSAIVKYALSKVATRTEPFDEFWTVYGDDIIVPSRAYQVVIETLETLGFSVNKSKSYNTGEYRESCGKEYYAGVDVTPLYYRTPFYRKRITPGAYGSWCSSANNALLHRLPLYRWHLLNKCLRFSRRYGPYFVGIPEVSPYLYSPNPTNFHVKARWNKDLQRREGRFISVSSRPRDGEESDDTLRYFRCLIDMSKRPGVDRAQLDESPSPMAMHGCVEHFSSTALPIVPYIRPSKLTNFDRQ